MSIDYKLVSEFDTETKTIIKQDKWSKKRINLKEKGYRLIYLEELKEILLQLNSVTQIYIIIDLLGYEVDSNFNLNKTIKEISIMYDISYSTAKRLVKRLKELDVIKGDKSPYKVNPFLVIPNNCDDRTVKQNQDRWN